MSLFNCHKQQPQPWMSYISPAMITFNGNCCSPLVTNTVGLLPFQIISEGDYVGAEIRPYGGAWVPVTLTINTILTEGFYIHSFAGGATDYVLECGMYEFRVTAGEMWWFEPFTVVDFTMVANGFTLRDDIMTALKFAEQQLTGIPVIAPCDSFLPFMFRTLNASTAPTYFLVDADGTETALTITVDVSVIDGRTYYIHDGACFYPFLECGTYRIKIVDGAFTYWSVEFNAVCNMNDIPDGYRAMVDFNGCVMRDEDGDILTEECSMAIEEINYGPLYNWYAATDVRNITSEGWHVPTRSEFYSLMRFLDNDGLPLNNTAGVELKDISYWELPSTGINSVGFNGRGNGFRSTAGGYFFLLRVGTFHTTTERISNPSNVHRATLYSSFYGTPWVNTINIGDTDDFADDIGAKHNGAAIRPVKDSTTLSDGEEGTYTDPSGYVYRTICIGTQEWVADNIKTQHYRNGDPIPEVTDNAAWVALDTGAMCAYNNDWSNV